MEKEGDLREFECGVEVCARWASLLGFSQTTISRFYRERSKKDKISGEQQSSGEEKLVGRQQLLN